LIHFYKRYLNIAGYNRTMMGTLDKFESAILGSISSLNEQDAFCDLEIQCSDGSLAVQGLIFAAICPAIVRVECGSLDMQCLILPDVLCSEFLLFLRKLLNPLAVKFNWMQEEINVLQEVAASLGLDVASHFHSIKSKVTTSKATVPISSSAKISDASSPPLTDVMVRNSGPVVDRPTDLADKVENVSKQNDSVKSSTNQLMRNDKGGDAENRVEPSSNATDLISCTDLPKHQMDRDFNDRDSTAGDKLDHNKRTTSILETFISEPSTASYSDLDNLCIFFDERSSVLGKKCLLNLNKVDINIVADEILTENFCDQEGRLVCLVCYKIMAPTEFQTYRDHIKCHDQKQLEKVSIIMPEIGRGGPGLRKRFLTDSEIEKLYLNKEEGSLHCNKCSKTFHPQDKQALRKHVHYHAVKEKNYVYQCTECCKQFNDPSNLKRHKQSVHEKQVLRCLHCDFEDRRKHKLEDHLLSVHKDKVLVYDDVAMNKGDDTLTEDLTEPHLPLFNAGQPVEPPNNPFLYKCSGCPFKKRKLEEVEQHIKNKHKALAEPASTSITTTTSSATPSKVTTNGATVKRIALKPREPTGRLEHRCDVCDKLFAKLSQLNQHRFRVHNIEYVTEFACKYCGIHCANKPGLRAHERTHLERKFSCNACSKSFLLLSLLREHVERGVCNLENRTCQVCGKLFVDRMRRDIHYKIHRQEKSFRCSVCNKSFIQKRSLKEHSLTHESVRRFECTLCTKKFVQNNHLKYHLSSQHPGEFPSETKHACDLCTKAFPYLYQLKRHQRVHGPGARGGSSGSALQCGVCSNWFSTPALLQGHQKTCALDSPAASAGSNNGCGLLEPGMIVSVEQTLNNTIHMSSYSQAT